MGLAHRELDARFGFARRAARRRRALSLRGQQLADLFQQPGLAGELHGDPVEGVARIFGEEVPGVHAGHCRPALFP
jgi:hypothetical protein